MRLKNEYEFTQGHTARKQAVWMQSLFLPLHHAALNGVDPHDDAFLKLTEGQCASECYQMSHNCNLRPNTLLST